LTTGSFPVAQFDPGQKTLVAMVWETEAVTQMTSSFFLTQSTPRQRVHPVTNVSAKLVQIASVQKLFASIGFAP
jgi:hypothetical protein